MGRGSIELESHSDKKISLDDIISIFKRRWKAAVVVGMIVAGISIAYALLAPPSYRSESTILIEQQEIPRELVRSTVTSFAAQRIQMIIQRVMTYSKLVELIKKYDLYEEEREEEPLEWVVDEMRKDISHRMISAEVVDPRSGRPVEATIAFKIGYENQSPKTAQLVANELTSLFLSENIKTRQAMAEDAEAFLADEVQRLQQQSEALEARLAQFKEKNLRKLPELTSLNMNLMERTEREYFEISRQIRTLEERRIFLESSLSQQEPTNAVVGAGQEATLTPTARARLLQNRYITLLATYSENHPDVVKTRRELDRLLEEGDYPSESRFVKRQVEIYQAELADARSRYGDAHPDVKQLVNKLAALRERLDSGSLDNYSTEDLNDADNPAYVQLATSLKTVKVELRQLRQSRDQVKAKLDQLETAIVDAPKVEKEYRELTRDYENTVSKYQELKAKQLEARMAKSLEQESKGERFTLIEPPLTPVKPVRPNRLLIASGGLLLALLAAGLSVLALEQLDQTFRSPSSVAGFLGQSPLASIPHITTPQELVAEKRLKYGLAAGCVVLFLAALATIHFTWMPIDVLWYVALRKLS
ncbi:MAG: Wzz/FepE/Etk N-terminal domain-containing protein [Pseudomonadota bacterium]|nr:lipopolysaccharide biosynthesis protein [Pseudomonadales bacterium]MDY6920898.1 Wzz/FepE/Etk N-terminal domain-containing protein [Pseudomonadota bacterium]